jgi:hypothetical protein
VIRKMKAEEKVAVGVTALLITLVAVGMSMVGAQSSEYLDFTVTVSGIDVGIDIGDTDFGELRPGESSELAAFTLTNSGTIPAKVEAQFTTSGDTGYGLVDPDIGEVIPAGQFTINDYPLDVSGSIVQLDQVGAGDARDYVAELAIPEDQAPGAYAGTVELTFTPRLNTPD